MGGWRRLVGEIGVAPPPARARGKMWQAKVGGWTAVWNACGVALGANADTMSRGK